MAVFDRTLAAFKRLLPGRKNRQVPFSDLFVRFQDILAKNTTGLELIADMRAKMGGEYVFDRKYLQDCVNQLAELVRSSAYDLNFITNNQHLEIFNTIENLVKSLEMELAGKFDVSRRQRVYSLDDIDEELDDTVGFKAYNLSRIMNLPQTNIPGGFVVSVAGFRDYLAYNNLFEKIEQLIETCRQEKNSVQATADAIRLLILGGDIPPELRRMILAAAERICGKQTRFCFFSVRSSAVGEDGELSFAGLHDSLLNVPFGELLSGYKKVVASLYNSESLEYRCKMNLFSMEMAMPVLYQVMVDSRVAGVLYTLDPNRPERQEAILSACWGLGSIVVDGRGSVDMLRLARTPPHGVLEQTIALKRWMMGSLTDGSLQEVPAKLRSMPCVTPQEAARIAEVGMILERYFKGPLDIEWSLDEAGKLWILQARQLRTARTRPLPATQLSAALKGHRILLQDKGIIAYRGIGAGPVWIARDSDGLSRFPAGAVLVSRYSPPWLAKAIPRANAIVTDIGAATGHMATVAREFRVPTIVDAGVATAMLPEGREVTVDAERNIIYEGRIDELLQHELLDKSAFEITPEFQLLRRLMKKVAPLFLTDPQAPNFNARDCRTFHDIMRFVHEKAFEALISVGKDPRTLFRRGAKRLKSNLPLNLVVVDVGGGLAEDVDRGVEVEPEQITSTPLKAIWEGMSCPGAWSTEPAAADFKGLMSSLTKTQTTQVLGGSLPGVNLAVIGANYVNLSLPLGYHFTAVDAGMGPAPENNYISFRFVGGVTDITRRSRRAALLAAILEQTEFIVETKGDLVLARANNLSAEQMKTLLFLLGMLIGFTRQLDILLKKDSDISFYLEKFTAQLNQANQKRQLREGESHGKDHHLYFG